MNYEGPTAKKSTANQRIERKEHNAETEKYIHLGYNAVADDTGLSSFV